MFERSNHLFKISEDHSKGEAREKRDWQYEAIESSAEEHKEYPSSFCTASCWSYLFQRNWRASLDQNWKKEKTFTNKDRCFELLFDSYFFIGFNFNSRRYQWSYLPTCLLSLKLKWLTPRFELHQSSKKGVIDRVAIE